jgi:dTDP-4-amino-4,6-dideoxygalactose transaminase
VGPQVEAFERAFADYEGVAHCVSMANGTDAIELALRSLGVKAGDRVATAANAGMYTGTALLALGARPHFMDVDAAAHSATLAEVRKALDAGVRAVALTHLYGIAAPQTAAIAALCRQRGVALLEDCAQAHGAIVEGRRVGAWGDAASFSFYPTKNLGALGDGGAIVTNDETIAARARQLRQYGWTTKYHVAVKGARNSRLDEMQAAILLTLLPTLDAANQRRRQIAARYDATLAHRDVAVPGRSGPGFVAHLYVVKVASRASLRAHLQAHGVGTDIHYPVPDHRQAVFGAEFADCALPVTEALADRVLTLPCYPEMTDAEVDEVVAAVNRWIP